MVINFQDYNQGFSGFKDISLAYDDMLDKVLNENTDQIHTMLMKSDFENFLGDQNKLFTESLNFEYADLSDFKLYEKELSNNSGDEKR